jgi:hypothetical protein
LLPSTERVRNLASLRVFALQREAGLEHNLAMLDLAVLHLPGGCTTSNQRRLRKVWSARLITVWSASSMLLVDEPTSPTTL